MAVDAWNAHRESVFGRTSSAIRFAIVAFAWMVIIAGPPIVGGLLGWMATRDMTRSSPVSGLLGQLPEQSVPVLVTLEEVEAVGLDPRDVQAIIKH
ncbi:MAG: hypothetical protein NXI18_16985 [Alphaproteobacteria bacterium]|nr:hypothetical protein [Alphaproteobacteria bacterium]